MAPAARRIAGISLCLAAAACAQFPGGAEGPPRIAPAGTVSLAYPNEWDINQRIALSNDGSRLIDASRGARHIRVWDWKNRKVVQRLSLNDEAQEGNDGKDHRWVLGTSPGQELALGPDGRLAACVSIAKPQDLNGHTSIRVWDMESGAVVADIPGYQHHVPGLDQEMVFALGCNSISFSPDGKHVAILTTFGSYNNNEAERNYAAEMSKGFDPKTGKYKNGMSYEEQKAQKYYPIIISGIALFDTATWKLERFFYRPLRQQLFNSRPLFDPESKTVSAVVFDRPPVKVNDSAWNRKWVGNRIVRWDIATGEQLEERDMPQLADSPENGVWWTALPGGREVWWQNVNIWWGQTDKEVEQCKQDPPSPAAFVSDEKITCADEWLVTILNLDTGKLRYLAPVKKNKSLIKGTQDFHWANISPDGAHVVLFHTTENTKNRLRASSSVEIRSMETLQVEGRYSEDIRFEMAPVFSGNSRYLAFPINKSSDWVKSALVFELPKKK